MNITFDGINKVIYLPQASTVNVIDVYSSWKRWCVLVDNLKYLQAFKYVGGDPTINGEYLGTTYFVMNEWRIQPYSGTYTLVVNGNIFTEDGNSPFSSPSSGNVMIYNKFSNLSSVTEVSTSGSSITASEIRDEILGTKLTALTDKTTIGGWIANGLLSIKKFISLS